jgi:hypothetical protein
MVLLPKPLQLSPQIDHALFSKEGTSSWHKFFRSDSPSAASISVPTGWVDFINSKLLSPADYNWARYFLQSKAWHIINDGPSLPSREFKLPASFPVKSAPVCALSSACEVITQGFLTPQAPRKSAEMMAHPLLPESISRKEVKLFLCLFVM